MSFNVNVVTSGLFSNKNNVTLEVTHGMTLVVVTSFPI